MSECYKVVRSDGDTLTTTFTISAILATKRGCITYVPGKPTSLPQLLGKRKHGLIVFRSVEDALRFLSYVGGDGELWECSCGEIYHKPSKLSGSRPLTDSLYYSLCPEDPGIPGAEFTNQVTLTRKVGVGTSTMCIPVTPHETEWWLRIGQGKNRGLVFDTLAKGTRHYGRLVYGYREHPYHERNVLVVTGKGVLFRPSGGVTLAPGELAAWSISI